MGRKYKYDVAISFAEKERDAALAMALALEIAGFKNIYYYPDHLVATAGLILLTTLSKIYSSQCEYIVVLLSDKYLRGNTSKEELKIIYKRIKEEENIRCVIPVRLQKKLDLSKLPLLNEITYINWDFNPKQIAHILKTDFGTEQVSNIGELLAKEEKQHISIKQNNNAEVAKNQINTANIKI